MYAAVGNGTTARPSGAGRERGKIDRTHVRDSAAVENAVVEIAGVIDEADAVRPGRGEGHAGADEVHRSVGTDSWRCP